MPRYIDIDKTLRSLHFSERLKYAKMLNSQQIADVRENVHGRWKDIFDDGGKWEETVCSVCGKGCGEVLPVWKYCPHCGAKMEEKYDN